MAKKSTIQTEKVNTHIVEWLKNGVQPTDTVKRILQKAKILNI